MNLKILTLNCNVAYVPGLWDFLSRIFAEEKYDFVLFQELKSRASPFFDAGMSDILGSYKLLRVFDPIASGMTEVGIAYRKNFKLEESFYYPFPPFTRYFSIPVHQFGFLKAIFSTPERKIIIGSVHLHSDEFWTRKRDVKFIKRSIMQSKDSKIPVIFGGDFNNALPGEKTSHNKIFAPEFLNLAENSGPTVDSNYVEAANFASTFVVYFLKLFRIRLRMKVDHIYADKKTAANHKIICNVLPDRISDHSPLEVILN